jgi:hypothetical protein
MLRGMRLVVLICGTVARAVAVLKVRESRQDTVLHEFRIDPPRLAVGPRLATVDLAAREGRTGDACSTPVAVGP